MTQPGVTRLRADVDIIHFSGGFEVRDRRTGLEFEIDAVPGVLDEHGVVLPGEGGGVVRSFLARVGLLDEGLNEGAIRVRQQAYLRQTREEHLLDAINEALEFARASIPFYRDDPGYRQPACRDLASFARIPPLRKQDVRLRFHELIPESLDLEGGLARGELEWTATSGTTDERLQVVCSMAEVGLPDDCATLWELPLAAEPKTAVLTSPTCMGTECYLGHAPYQARLRGQNTLYLESSADLFSMPDVRVREIVAELERLEPDLLVVNPVYLHWVLLRAHALGLSLPRPRAVISTYQYLAGVQRRAIEATLRVPVFCMYTATELAGTRVALSCPRGHLHVLEDSVHVEVIPGSPALPGRVGHLAITTHSNRVMPLLRYLVGDVGRLRPSECPCAYGHLPLLELHGRAKDVLCLGDHRVTTRMLDEAVGTPTGLDFYQCTQTGPTSVELRVVAREALDDAALGERVAEVCRAEVRLVRVRRLDPAPSLKFPLTINPGIGPIPAP